MNPTRPTDPRRGRGSACRRGSIAACRRGSIAACRRGSIAACRRGSIAACRRGSIAVEFALIVPILAMLIAGGADLGFWLRDWMRMERVSAEVADLATQRDALSQADITLLFNAGQQVAGTSLDVTRGGGAQYISLVDNLNGRNRVVWQRSIGATNTYASAFGAVGSLPSFPAAWVVPSGQTVLVAEAVVGRRAWVFSALLWRCAECNPTTIRTYAIYRPRSAQLSSPPA